VKSKVCNYCKCDLPESSFGRKKRRSGAYGIREVCKKCHVIKNSISRNLRGRKTSKLTAENSRRRASKYYYDNRSKSTFKIKASHYQSLRRSRKSKATPLWLNDTHLSEIKNFYWLAKDLTAVSGDTYHVDHIVPLKGENVCGLHVPWNLQVLPADINLSKGNRYANDA